MNGKKREVVYCSHAGNTRLLAGWLAEKPDADLSEPQTVKPWPTARNEIAASLMRERETGRLPGLKTWPENLSRYDLVLSGWPVRIATVASPAMPFLSPTEFGGLMPAPFCTRQDGPGRSFAHLGEQAGNGRVPEGAAFYKPVKRLEASARKPDAWINTLFAA